MKLYAPREFKNKRMMGLPSMREIKLMTRDTDRDGVMNMIDCRPYNRAKQGPAHEEPQPMTGDIIRPHKILTLREKIRYVQRKQEAQREAKAKKVAKEAAMIRRERSLERAKAQLEKERGIRARRYYKDAAKSANYFSGRSAFAGAFGNK